MAGAAAGTRGKVGTVIGVEGGFVVLESGLAESLVGFGLEKLDLGFFRTLVACVDSSSDDSASASEAARVFLRCLFFEC